MSTSERVAAVAKAVECDCVWLNEETTAKDALAAADAVMFAPARIAEIVQRTGLSLQSVNEVVRELRNV